MPTQTERELENLNFELGQVDDGIRAADANGDAEGVRRLGEYRQQLEQRRYTAGRQAEARQREATMRKGFRVGIPAFFNEGMFQRGVLDNLSGLLALGEEGMVAGAEAGGADIRGLTGSPLARQQNEMNVRRILATEGNPDAEQAADAGELMSLGVQSFLTGPLSAAARARAGMEVGEDVAPKLIPYLAKAGKETAVDSFFLTGAPEEGDAGDVLRHKAMIMAGSGIVTLPAALVIGHRALFNNWIARMARQSELSPQNQADLTLAGYWRSKFGPQPKATLNIGLNVGDKVDALSPEQVIQTLRQNGANVTGFEVVRGVGGENTVVATLGSPLDPQTGLKVSEALGQDAIAQKAGINGDLFGPRPENFGGKFDETYFTEASEGLRNRLGLKALPLTLSQRTGNAVARSVEAEVKATAAQRYLAEQAAETGQMFDTMVDYINNNKGNRGAAWLNTSRRVGAAFQKKMGQLQAAATKRYGAMEERALAEAALDSEGVPLTWKNVGEAADNWATEAETVWWHQQAPGAADAKAVRDMQALDRYVNTLGQKAASIEDLILMRRNLNARIRGYKQKYEMGTLSSEEAQARRALVSMRKAVEQDVDAFLMSNPDNRPAVKALRTMSDADKEYGEFVDRRREMRQTFVGQVFGRGEDKLPVNPELEFERLLDLEPAQQQAMVGLLKEMDPEVLADLKAQYLQRAFASMMSPPTAGRAASVGRVDPDLFASAITRSSDLGGGLRGSVLFDDKELKAIEGGLANIRILNEVAAQSNSVNRQPGVQQSVMAVATMATAFLARMAVRWKILGRVEDRLFTKEGLEALETLRNVYRPGGKAVGLNDVNRAAAVITGAAFTQEKPDAGEETNDPYAPRD